VITPVVSGLQFVHRMTPPEAGRSNQSRHPSRPTLLSAIIGGVAATSLMTPVAYLAPTFQLQQLDFAAMLGSLVTNQATTPLSGTWLFGMLLHVANGSLLFPAIYAWLVYPTLGGPPWLRGVAYGVALWGLAQALVMPMAGMGVFSSATPRPVVALAWSLGTHLLYGAVLGAIATRRVARAIDEGARAEASHAA